MWWLYILCFIGGIAVGVIGYHLVSLNVAKYMKEKYIDTGILTPEQMASLGYEYLHLNEKEKKSDEKEN